ncbi:MAG: hypothetical protein K0S04_390 [Herbinix sp.]|jgi:GGDEF domain-containing protein|nr:hypothetical protein [Herbinix sp.]
MGHFGTKKQPDFNTSEEIILKEMHRFTDSAEELLNSNTQKHSYTMLIFDVTLLGGASESCSLSAFRDLISYIGSMLKNYVPEPNLFCQINSNTFAILMKDCKAVDVALLAISLTEEANQFHPGSMVKLTFGSCLADRRKIDIIALCRQAYYAKNTITDQNHQILADYNELESYNNKFGATTK